jgi:hypothetical protein
MHFSRIRVLPAFCLALACTRTPDTSAADSAASQPHQAFWASVTALCGKAYGGRVADSEPPDTVMSKEQLVMHVRECSADTIRIPFHVGANRSRTWVLTRTATGLRLKHDHRHEDGTADSVTMYGGDTRDAGSADRQEFFADSLTASLIPAARANVWTLELHPGHMFVYALRRDGATRRFRAEFDLASPVAEPPAPWGSER